MLNVYSDSSVFMAVQGSEQSAYSNVEDPRKLLMDKISKVDSYLPRPLTDEEKGLPPTDLQRVVKKLVNQPGYMGCTPLIKATTAALIKPSEKESMQILVSLGADVDKQIAYGLTAASFAKDQPDLMQFLQSLKEGELSLSTSAS